MRYPEFIKESGGLSLVAPSYGCTIMPYSARLDAAEKKLTEMGYTIKEAKHVRLDEGIGRSGPADELGAELNSAYLDPETDAVLSVGGGETMCEVVPYIDFEAIKNARPKWYMGYSDNTNFTFLSTILSDTAAIYGPCATKLGFTPLDVGAADAWELIRGKKLEFTGYPTWEREGFDTDDPLAPLNLTEKTEYRLLNCNGTAKMRGRLIGGCGDLLFTLMGTRFDKVREFNEKYKNDGSLWFIEFCDLHPMDVRRVLWAMREAGWFDTAAGFIFGRPLRFGEEQLGMNMYNAVEGAIGRLGVPIVMDADFGHLPPAIPIISGAIGEIEATESSLKLRHILA